MLRDSICDLSRGPSVFISPFKRVSALAAATALIIVASTGVASADGRNDGEIKDDGITANAKATMTLDGPVKGGGGTAVSVSVPALCWWKKVDLDSNDVAALEQMFQLITGGFLFGGNDEFKQILEDQKKSDHPFEWYVRQDSESATEAQLKAAGCYDPSGPYKAMFLASILRPFEPGEEPEPLPDPKFMAEVAMEHIDINKPELNWNPKAQALGGGTLVNLPTWFWVNNADSAIGDANGEREVIARAGSGARQVTVTVTAKAGQLQIASPGGAASCSTDQARVHYSRSTAASSACILPFERASTGYPEGFPVIATVAWSASWTGTGPGVPGGVHTLDGITQRSETPIPVRESQATVRDVG